mgnify:CR=1 FL=1
MINTKTETMAVSVVKRNRRKATTAPVIPVVTTDIISIPKGESEMKTAENDLAQAKYEYVFKTKVLDFYLGKPLKF